MLVLSRQKNEEIEIVIPPSKETRCMRVAVVDIRGDKVRLGIEAPTEIAVHRSEVMRAIERERGLGPLSFARRPLTSVSAPVL